MKNEKKKRNEEGRQRRKRWAEALRVRGDKTPVFIRWDEVQFFFNLTFQKRNGSKSRWSRRVGTEEIREPLWWFLASAHAHSSPHTTRALSPLECERKRAEKEWERRDDGRGQPASTAKAISPLPRVSCKWRAKKSADWRQKGESCRKREKEIKQEIFGKINKIF